MKSLRHLNGYLAHHRSTLILGALFAILSSFCAILPPRFFRYSLDLLQTYVEARQFITNEGTHPIVQQQLYQGLAFYSGLMLLATTLKGCFSFLARWTILSGGKRIEYALKNELYSHYQTLPLN